MRLVWLCSAALIACPGLANAQDPAQPDSGANPLFGAAEKVYRIFSAPVHPTLDPVAPGGGLAGGIGATPEPIRRDAGMLGFEGRASASLRKYWVLEGSTWWQSSSTYRLEAFGRSRSMRELDFYGLGIDAPASQHSNLQLDDRSVGGLGWYRVEPWLGVGARLEGLWTDVDPGHDSELPSIETLFAENTAPGLSDQPAFLRSQIFVDVNYPNQFERARTGGDYQVAYNVYSDRGSSPQYSFRRFSLEMQQRFGLGPRPGRLTLHLLLSTTQTDEGNEVPFYLMPTLGGSHNLMAFNEQIIGGDQTIATLRGFEDFRFRDRNLLLVQAEYRFKIWGPVQGTVFVDGGQVAPDVSDWSLDRMKGDVGFSLSLMRSDSTVVRIDFAFGGEGAQHFLAPGRVLAP